VANRNAVVLPSLPSLPRSSRRNRPVVPCACGCGAGTRGTWFPGHDGRATGWAVRVERGMMTIDDVPANERAGARIMIARREKERAAEAAK
jgi:hypothetical protein